LDIAELQQDILKWSLYIDFAILNIEITFNSDSPTTATTEQQTITNATTEQQTITNATTEQQTITNATTTMGTNDISKDTEIKIYIGTGTGLGGLGGISSIVIIIFIKRRKKNTNNSQDRTENNSGNPEGVLMTNC
jgi:hypothetical protein